MERCAQCGANLAMVGRVHRCVPKTAVLDLPTGAKVGAAEFRHLKKLLDNPTGPSPLIIEGAALLRKLGRPRIGETRDKPWIAESMSRATWYRRKAERRGGK